MAYKNILSLGNTHQSPKLRLTVLAKIDTVCPTLYISMLPPMPCYALYISMLPVDEPVAFNLIFSLQKYLSLHKNTVII